MAEARIHVGFYRDPKVSQLKIIEREAFLRLILWSEEAVTDGHIPPHALVGAGVQQRSMGPLEAVGLIDRNGDGWHIRNFLRYQIPAEKRRRRIEQRREAAMARWDQK